MSSGPMINVLGSTGADVGIGEMPTGVFTESAARSAVGVVAGPRSLGGGAASVGVLDGGCCANDTQTVTKIAKALMRRTAARIISPLSLSPAQLPGAGRNGNRSSGPR